MNTVTQLDVNDYLDFSSSEKIIGDILWQNEILEKLKKFFQ